MSKVKLFNLMIILVAFFLTCLAIAFGSYFRSGLVMQVGYPSEIRVRAPFDRDVVNEFATAQNREAALVLARGIQQVYTADLTEWAITENNLQTLQNALYEIKNEYQIELAAFENLMAAWEIAVQEHLDENARTMADWETARMNAVQAGASPAELQPMPELPLPPEAPEWEALALERFGELAMTFSEDAQVYIAEMPTDDFNEMWTAIMTVAWQVQSDVITEITFATQVSVQQNIQVLPDFVRATEDLIQSIVLNHLRPNAIPNDDINQFNFNITAANYERVIFRAGQIIVDEGEIVTEDIYHMLADLGMLQTESLADNILPLISVFVLVLALFAASVLYLYFYRPEMANKKESLLLFTLYLLTIMLMWTISDFNLPYFPLLIFAMLTAILIDRRAAAMLTFVVVIVSFFITDGSLQFLLFYSATGLILGLLSRYTTERSKVFLIGAVIMAVQFVLSITITVVVERNHALYDFNEILITAGFAALSGLLTVIICTGSLPLWETLFGVVTPFKLLDLTNPTNLLLRRLTIEAPGTYHHSLVVANLAEKAAYDIGANAHATRVGGYYHDIGKLKFPHYFAENLDGENPHDHLDPINSVQLIISHVSYGLTLASEHRLPQFVRDIIKEHQGTTLLQFFYAKALKNDPNVDEKDYRYPYTIPQTRESACIMLADSIEAAVRASVPKMKSVDEVEAIIKNIIRAKLHDGQLADSQLSIKDVNIIEESFFRVLKGMYHERIAYPKVTKPEPTAETH